MFGFGKKAEYTPEFQKYAAEYAAEVMEVLGNSGRVLPGKGTDSLLLEYFHETGKNPFLKDPNRLSNLLRVESFSEGIPRI